MGRKKLNAFEFNGENLVGNEFGRLTVILFSTKKRHPSGKTTAFWICRCKCRKEIEVSGDHLRSGHTISCGCFSSEKTIERNSIHGRSKTILYQKWKGMKSRCQNPNNRSYKNYGARGINVSKRWSNFMNYFNDMGPSFRKGLSIERKDNNGNYEPSNCRWATAKEQANNTRKNRHILMDGKKIRVGDQLKKINLSYVSFLVRIKKGMTELQALTFPKRKRNWRLFA